MILNLVFSILTGAVSLAMWAALGIGANFGVHPVLAAAGMLWLATLGLPASVGVALAATVWGRVDPLSGFKGFLVLSAVLGFASQIAAGHLLHRSTASARARSAMDVAAGGLGRGRPGDGWFGGLMGDVPPHEGATGDHRRTRPSFRGPGMAAVHGQTPGLSPSQKANPTYATLMRLLRLPPGGDMDALYVEELVRQAREARAILGSFRSVRSSTADDRRRGLPTRTTLGGEIDARLCRQAGG